MTKTLQKYTERADEIKADYRRQKGIWERNTELLPDVKAQRIKAKREETDRALGELRKEYLAAEEQYKIEFENQAFCCVGKNDRSAYLQTVETADGMNSDARLKFAQTALGIEDYDNLRAIARSAYTQGDNKTLKYIAETAPAGTARDIGELMQYNNRYNGDPMAQAMDLSQAFSLYDK